MIVLYLLYCVSFLWPQVCPFTPESLAFPAPGLLTAPRCWKTRAGKERNRERDGEKKRELEGEEGSRANYGPKKTKGYISMIPPAVLFMSCVLSRRVTFTSTLALSEGKQAEMTWCSIFHLPLFFFFSSLFSHFFLQLVDENVSCVWFPFFFFSSILLTSVISVSHF